VALAPVGGPDVAIGHQTLGGVERAVAQRRAVGGVTRDRRTVWSGWFHRIAAAVLCAMTGSPRGRSGLHPNWPTFAPGCHVSRRLAPGLPCGRMRYMAGTCRPCPLSRQPVFAPGTDRADISLGAGYCDRRTTLGRTPTPLAGEKEINERPIARRYAW
jgi:hypothetical protein